MKYFASILFGCLLAVISSPAIASTQSVCRGQVTLSAGAKKVDVALPQPVLDEEGQMGLWHPITEDTENGVQLTIQKIIKTSAGVRVLATYDYSDYTGFLTFDFIEYETGNVVLSDFKGFEGANSFGPSELKCSRE